MAAYEATLNNALLDTLQNVPATQNVHEAGDGWTFDYQARLIFMSVVYHGIAHRTDITTVLTIKASIYQSWMSGVIVPHTLSDFNPDYQKSGGDILSPIWRKTPGRFFVR